MCHYDNCEYEVNMPSNLKQENNLIYEGIQYDWNQWSYLTTQQKNIMQHVSQYINELSMVLSNMNKNVPE